jgi:hypothetical protein
MDRDQRDPAHGRRVLDPAYSMGDHAARLARDRGHHLGWGRSALEQPVDVGRGPAAQQGVAAARKDSGQVGGLGAWSPVSDPVDPAVNTNQRPDPKAVADLVLAETRAQQLRPGDYAMRPRRDPADYLLR